MNIKEYLRKYTSSIPFKFSDLGQHGLESTKSLCQKGWPKSGSRVSTPETREAMAELVSSLKKRWNVFDSTLFVVMLVDPRFKHLIWLSKNQINQAHNELRKRTAELIGDSKQGEQAHGGSAEDRKHPVHEIAVLNSLTAVLTAKCKAPPKMNSLNTWPKLTLNFPMILSSGGNQENQDIQILPSWPRYISALLQATHLVSVYFLPRHMLCETDEIVCHRLTLSILSC